jgi:hypothetical protein
MKNHYSIGIPRHLELQNPKYDRSKVSPGFDMRCEHPYADSIMIIVVADPISERGIELLRKPGWQVVTPPKDGLAASLAAADALIVRSATLVTAQLRR